MAIEIKSGDRVALTGDVKKTFQYPTTVVQGCSGKWVDSNQDVGTSWESLGKGDLGDIRAVMVSNIDPTNYIELSLDGGTTTHSKIYAGGACGLMTLPDSTANVSARANTAAVDVLYTLLESS